MAAYILEHRELFAAKRVVDFGAGSGVAAIAAALAGADRVIACEIDDDAFDAVRANADLNHVCIGTCRSLDECAGTIDIVLAADVLYNKNNLFLMEIGSEEKPETCYKKEGIPNGHAAY